MKVLATGGAGMLGAALKNVFNAPGFEYIPIDIQEADITSRDSIASAIAAAAPDIVISCAAFTNVDECETKKDLAFAVNGTGAGNTAFAAAKIGVPIIHISTDYVFDGSKIEPYLETDAVNPLGVYGASKLEGERLVAENCARHYILRTAWLYGKGGKNFVDTICSLADSREEITVVSDQIGCPTFTVHLAGAIKTVVEKVLVGEGDPGIYHVAGSGRCSWFDFAKEITSIHPGILQRVLPVTTKEFGRPAPRPANSMLCMDKIRAAFGVVMPDWRDALREYMTVS